MRWENIIKKIEKAQRADIKTQSNPGDILGILQEIQHLSETNRQKLLVDFQKQGQLTGLSDKKPRSENDERDESLQGYKIGN